MKYCEKCGNELFDEAVICPKCGCAVRYEKPQKTGEPSARINVCALVGFILSLVSVISMLVNYVIGLVVIFAIVVACPYLMRGIAALVT